MLRATIRVHGGVDVPGIMGPEMCRDLSRTTAHVGTDGEDAVVVITATDVSAMRAAVNSHLECIKVVEDVLKLTK